MKKEKHIIWSNYFLDYDDWKDELEEQYPDLSEDERVSLMYEINSDYLGDERMNLNIQLDRPILVIGDLGLWDGRRSGYKEIESGNIRDCLYADTDYSTWYVDKLGDPHRYNESDPQAGRRWATTSPESTGFHPPAAAKRGTTKIRRRKRWQRYGLITELYERTRAAVTSPQEWQKFLTTACRNYKLPFDEQLLLYAQRPDATAVLEIEGWNRQFGRWVNRGATGIAVFDRNAPGRARLKYYFDISDTHPGRFARRVPLWQVRPEQEAEITEALENSFGELADKGSFAETLLSAAKNAVEDNLPDYLSELKYYKENSLLEELDDFNLEISYRNAVRNSVGYILLARCGIDPALYFTDDDFRDVVDFNTPQVLNTLGVATGDIGQMCLTEISRTITALERHIARLQSFRRMLILYSEIETILMKGAIHMNGITYRTQDGYRLPNLLPPQKPEVTIGKYGLLRRRFLQEHRRVMFTNLLTSGRLTKHLLEIEQTARSRMEQITEQMKAEGVTEQMKAADQMKWVGLMNSIRQAAEETVLAELIYS